MAFETIRRARFLTRSRALLLGAGVVASNVNEGQRIRSAPSPWRKLTL